MAAANRSAGCAALEGAAAADGLGLDTHLRTPAASPVPGNSTAMSLLPVRTQGGINSCCDCVETKATREERNINASVATVSPEWGKSRSLGNSVSAGRRPRHLAPAVPSHGGTHAVSEAIPNRLTPGTAEPGRTPRLTRCHSSLEGCTPRTAEGRTAQTSSRSAGGAGAFLPPLQTA